VFHLKTQSAENYKKYHLPLSALIPLTKHCMSTKTRRHFRTWWRNLRWSAVLRNALRLRRDRLFAAATSYTCVLVLAQVTLWTEIAAAICVLASGRAWLRPARGAYISRLFVGMPPHRRGGSHAGGTQEVQHAMRHPNVGGANLILRCAVPHSRPIKSQIWECEKWL